MKKILLVIGLLLFTSCGNSTTTNSSAEHTQTEPQIETITNQKPLTPIEACSLLTAEKIEKVYTKSKFVLENKRTDPATANEAYSICRYQIKDVEFADNYHVELEIRVKATSTDAKEMLNSILASDLEKKIKEISGLGEKAYYFNYSMANNGPYIIFLKGSSLYKLNIQSVKSGVMNTIEKELLTIAKSL